MDNYNASANVLGNGINQSSISFQLPTEMLATKDGAGLVAPFDCKIKHISVSFKAAASGYKFAAQLARVEMTDSIDLDQYGGTDNRPLTAITSMINVNSGSTLNNTTSYYAEWDGNATVARGDQLIFFVRKYDDTSSANRYITVSYTIELAKT